MYELTCKTCSKKFFHKKAETNCCSEECRRAYQSKIMRGKKYAPRISHVATAAPAKAGASDTGKQMVDPKWCRKCEYGAGGEQGTPYCGSMLKTGTTRTALHPEGLTSTCYEFKPKQRKHKYQAPRK